MTKKPIPKWKYSLFLYSFAITKVPMIFYARPRIVNIDDNESRILIPYKRRNRNHVKSIYIGTLVVGADLCVGMLAMHHIQKINPRIVPVFKDFQANFLKKAMGPTEFVCDLGQDTEKLVSTAHKTKERQSQKMTGKAFSLVGNERIHVMDFSLTLSIKAR